jgi:hypothetical protein
VPIPALILAMIGSMLAGWLVGWTSVRLWLEGRRVFGAALFFGYMAVCLAFLFAGPRSS